MECMIPLHTKIQDEKLITLGKRIHAGHIYDIIYIYIYIYIFVYIKIYIQRLITGILVPYQNNLYINF